MSKVVNFMIALEQKRNVQRAYTADAEAATRAYGLSEREIAAVLSGDENAVFDAIGMSEDYETCKLVIPGLTVKMAA
jgi:hypothetical protein